MAMVLLDISKYHVFLYGGPQGNDGARATIMLTIPGAYGVLRFYPDAMALPANSAGPDVMGRQWYYVHYPFSQYMAAVDLLRNEKPVKLFFRDETLAAYITTADEPVGEGE